MSISPTCASLQVCTGTALCAPEPERTLGAVLPFPVCMWQAPTRVTDLAFKSSRAGCANCEQQTDRREEEKQTRKVLSRCSDVHHLARLQRSTHMQMRAGSKQECEQPSGQVYELQLAVPVKPTQTVSNQNKPN